MRSVWNGCIFTLTKKKIMSKFFFSDWSIEGGSATAYIIDSQTNQRVDTVYKDIMTLEIATFSGKPLGFYGLFL